MGMWSFYFLGKLYLYFRGYIRFHFILNLLLAIFVFLPVSKTKPVYRYLKAAQLILGIIFAFSLLWYDSYLPPFFYALKALRETGGISTGYAVHFILKVLGSWEIIILFLLLIVCIFIRNRVRLAPIVIILMVIVSLLEWSKNDSEELSSYLKKFHHSESQRIVHFEDSVKGAQDFDIIILHICSLSWDDLKATGMENFEFLKQFQYLFTNFNTVSSYTNPTIIRLLRANCGQQPHDALYRDAPKECFLLESLRTLGYETYSIIDNDAPPSYHYVYDMVNFALADPPIDFKNIPILQYDFDNTPIHDDLALFNKWWDARQTSKSKRAALYFDITTLHTGARWVTENEWGKRDLSSHYKESLLFLSEIIEKMFEQMASSGRKFVVIFVPEHGAALRGSKMQAAELRDIPFPKLTRVPVGIKLIGEGYPPIPEHQEIISKQTSYLALSYMLSYFLKEPPFGTGLLPSQNILADIPVTDFVSENKEAVIVKKGEDYFLYGKEKEWIKVPYD
jgi:cellulose synthase operon protein YhjU